MGFRGQGDPRICGLVGWETMACGFRTLGTPAHAFWGLFVALQAPGTGSDLGTSSPGRLRSREMWQKVGNKPQVFGVSP